jgi:hypothetical protein
VFRAGALLNKTRGGIGSLRVTIHSLAQPTSGLLAVRGMGVARFKEKIVNALQKVEHAPIIMTLIARLLSLLI